MNCSIAAVWSFGRWPNGATTWLLPIACRWACRAGPSSIRNFADFVQRIVAARQQQRPVILMMGAHPIKLGLSRFLVDLIERKWITHLATNGAGLIHDFELASFGGTSESVARWIQVGQFGLWQETSRLNDVARQAAAAGEGLGEAAGRILANEPAPHAAVSLAAAAWRSGVPMTIHVGIGCDIIHGHPNCDGAAWGAASDTDFLIFARSVEDLPGGVFINFGTAVTGPEVFLKALSMTRNVARQRGGIAGQFHHGRLRSDRPARELARRHALETSRAATTTGPGKRSWRGPWPAAGRAFSSRRPSPDAAHAVGGTGSTPDPVAWDLACARAIRPRECAVVRAVPRIFALGYFAYGDAVVEWQTSILPSIPPQPLRRQRNEPAVPPWRFSGVPAYVHHAIAAAVYPLVSASNGTGCVAGRRECGPGRAGPEAGMGEPVCIVANRLGRSRADRRARRTDSSARSR